VRDIKLSDFQLFASRNLHPGR